MATLVQRSFSGGELAPSLYARVDTAKYAAGLRTCRNMLIMRHGGAQNRPGSTFVCESKDSTKSVRLIPFVFNNDQTYTLEFGDQYMRVIKNGIQQKLASQNITGITAANPAVLTYSGADTYSNGDEVYISGVLGMTQVNNRWFKVADLNAGANTFELQTMDGVDLDASGYTAYSSGGTVSEVYELATPYLEADLFDLQFVQSADVITIVHPDYAPRELARSGDTSWTLSIVTFDPDIAAPTGCANSYGGGAGSIDVHYVITAIDGNTGEESLPGIGLTGVITGITNASPGVITSTAHGLSTNDIVKLTGIGGMTELNGNTYRVLSIGANTFSLTNLQGGSVNTTSFGAYTSGGVFTQVGTSRTGTAALSTSNVLTLTWTEVVGAQSYVIYKQQPVGTSNLNGVYGYIGISNTPYFADIGTSPDYNDNPPSESTVFEAVGDYPSAVTYVQQRRAFANTDNDPERVWLSRIGNFKNFIKRSPIQDDDPLNFVLAGRQVNSVRHMIDIGKLIIFTSGGEWVAQGDAAGIITPTDVNPVQYGYNGSSNLSPLVIGGNALFVQARGSIIRDLAFDDTAQAYRGQDLTIFSAHLFDEFTLNDWCYQQIPHSVVWAVRSDGILLGLTYVREHEMWAWHKHDFTDGFVESVCSVPEGNEDTLYLVIRRTINGRTTRYIEKFNTRQVSEALIKDAIFMDSALTYDGRHTGSTTMTLSGGTTWAFDELLTLTASAGTFTNLYVGNEIHLTGSDGTIIRFTIDGYTSATVVTGRPHKTVPVSMRSTAISTWAYAVDEVTGLWHLEGKAVSVFADGFVTANPNNDSYDQLTVTNGTVSLDKHYSVIHVGLPFISDIETLDIDTPQGETLADKKKLVNRVSIFVEDSRGIWAGAKAPTDDDVDPLEGLYELKIRNDENYDAPVSLRTGVVDINIKAEWNSNGRVFIRQIDPVPLAVLAVAPAGLYPFRG
jgi:Ubiquitin-activating enzyme E1 FCCH domain